ncbi:glycosyltransferase family 2 protein [Intrasporangium sp.]|uniref:glycosyltransferase family 2 protein n=1 Tax=Intrasporangium sp. TaxID=1925024 RepID=UPI00293B3F70|nr:glycosyltransferase [Intrasporangium sp.]MDV3223306.1 glycosyltransferase [Intrasporangium sp.]
MTQPGGRTRVTALVPTYNGEAFLKRTLDSLAAQTWQELEILIGDDCSSDATPEIVRAFAEEHANVVVVERESNLGWLRNSNDLMARASGELLFFAFHDDVVAPTYVERLAEALESRPGAVMAFSDMLVTEPDGETSPAVFDLLSSAHTALARGRVMARRPDNWWVPNRGLFRASAFRRVGGIHPNTHGEYSADWTWLLHLALLGDFVRVPETLCHKHYQRTSLSKAWPHSPEQQEALRRAGAAEVRASSAGPWVKLVLVTRLRWDLRRRVWQVLRRTLGPMRRRTRQLGSRQV